MKLAFIITNNLKHFIINRTLVFVTLFLGLNLCFFGLIYLHADNLSNYRTIDQNNWTMLNYKMSFLNTDTQSIFTFLDDIIQSQKLPTVRRLFAYTYLKNDNYILSGYYGDSLGYYLEDGVSFEKSQIKNPVLVSNCLLPQTYLLNVSKAKFKVIGHEFQVIGTGSFEVLEEIPSALVETMDRQVILPLESYKEIAPICSKVDLYFDRPLSEKETALIQNEFARRFPDENIKIPVSSEVEHSKEVAFTLLLVALAVGLSMANVIAFFQFWVDDNRKRYHIFRLCGATGINIYTLVTVELLLISSMSFFLGTIAYYLVMPGLKAFGFSYTRLNLQHIFILFGISVLLTWIAIHPTARKVSSKEIST